jgi:hypothetical protein
MKLIAHVIDGHHVDIRPAPVERDWMEARMRQNCYRSRCAFLAEGIGIEAVAERHHAP